MAETNGSHPADPGGNAPTGEWFFDESFKGTPVLIVEGQPYSGLDAINEGLSVCPTDDPLFCGLSIIKDIPPGTTLSKPNKICSGFLIRVFI
jgi:hypothetical protein